MIDGRLVNMPEKFVDALLFNQICLVSGLGGHLRRLSQVRRRQEQRNRFHPCACTEKDQTTPLTNWLIYCSCFCPKYLQEIQKVRGIRLGSDEVIECTDNDQLFVVCVIIIVIDNNLPFDIMQIRDS